jgi:hypothetical protein
MEQPDELILDIVLEMAENKDKELTYKDIRYILIEGLKP